MTLLEIDAVLAQQLAIFFLKGASVMVLFLSIDVLQNSVELTRAH